MPIASCEVAKLALPPLNVAVPSNVVPSKNFTVPVAVDGLTVAVKVTLCLRFDGLLFEVSAVVVLALFTVCESVGDVLPENEASPPYTAVIECEPAARDEVEKLAVPPATVDVPRVVAPSLNVTVPVAEEELIVAMKVTDAP